MTRRVLAALRRLAQAPGLRRLTQVRFLTRLSFALRGAVVEDRLRFAIAEIWSERVLTHKLRGSNVFLTIRHGTADVLILDEIFFQHEYEFPPEVDQLVRASRQTPLNVLDVGANVGLFGVWMLSRFPDARIVAVEPNPENAKVLRRTIEANDRRATWRLVLAAAGTAKGAAEFARRGHSTGGLAREGERGVAVEIVDFFELAAEADFIKLDVEGGEWPILRDPRLSSVLAPIVLEYHPDGCPQPDPRGAALAALRAAGYESRATSARPSLRTGIIWAWRDPVDQ
jgi:FkbM family methyltransferase